MPPFNGEESVAAWNEFYARPMPKRSQIITLQQRVEDSRKVSTAKPKKVRRK